MRKSKDKVFILLIASIVMAVLCSFITYWGTLQKREALDSVIHTYQVIESSDHVLSLLKDMESGHRAYIIVKDSAFLEHFQDARSSLITETANLRKLVEGDLPQTKFLENKILPAVENRKEASLNTVKIVNLHGKDSAAAWISSRIGKAYMDTIRLLVNHFNQNEQVMLTAHENNLTRNIMIEDIVQFSSFALVALTCTLAFLRLVRERKNINTLLEKLELANEGLEQKVNERTLQLTEAISAKDHFVGIASHDLKVPIAGVLGLIEVMRLDSQARSTRDNEYLNYMEESCKGMQNLISNLLDINRIDRKETVLAKQRIDLFPFLTKLEQGFINYARKKEIPLTIDKVSTVIDSDPGNLSRILENILSNAIKFSQPGQPVAMRTTLLHDMIRFDIIDHGPGIPEHEQSMLFTKFARLTNKPTGGESSSGLGLAIVKELTTLAGGSLRVTSTLGKGTTFSVVIPTA